MTPWEIWEQQEAVIQEGMTTSEEVVKGYNQLFEQDMEV